MRLVVGFAMLANIFLGGCDRIVPLGPEQRQATKAKLKQVRSECASKLTYGRLKEYVFDEAARIRNSDPRRLDQLAAHSVVRMDDPIVKTRNDELNITVCTGQFVLDLPPGVEDAFDGQPVIRAEVEYAAQAAADGSGLVYSMSGAEPIIYRIATLGLSAQPTQRIATAAPLASEDQAATNTVEADVPVQPPPPSPVREAARTTPPEARPVDRPVKGAASPSFKCGHAKTRTEKMVCGSGSLAAADRRMSAVYYSHMAQASAGAKRALRMSRDRFLARRERCSTETCVARVYEERVAEIRRLGGS